MKWKKTSPKTNTVTRFNGTNYDFSAKILNSKTIIVSLITMFNRKTISSFKKSKTSINHKTASSILIKFFSPLPNKSTISFWPFSQDSMQVASRNFLKRERRERIFYKIMRKRKLLFSNRMMKSPSHLPIPEGTLGILEETESEKVF